MTTKKSSANAFGFTFKDSFKSGAVAPAALNMAAFFFITILIPAMTLFAKVQRYDADGNVIGAAVAKSDYTYLFIGASDFLAPFLIVVAAAAAVLTGVFSFKFITSKKTVNVYYSLGITREKLFLGKYLAGAAMLSASVIIPLLLSFIVNIIACGMSAELFKAFIYITLSYTAVALSAFSVTAAVFASVGTTFETSIFTAILLFFPNIFFYGLQTLMERFLYGNPYGKQFIFSNGGAQTVESLSAKFKMLSPLFFGQKDLVTFAAMDASKKVNPQTVLSGGETVISGSPDFIWSVMWIALAAVICALGMLIFKKRKAEICGFIGTNKYLNSAGTFLMSFFAFCVAVNYLPLDTVVNIIIGAVVFAIVYSILDMLLLRDLKKFVKGLYRLPIEIAVAGVFVALFWTGLFGFSSKVPAASDIKSAAVSFAGVNDEFAFNGSDMGWYSNSGVNYSPSGLLVDGFESENDLKLITDIHKEIAAGKEDTSEYGKDIKFVYTLKNGSKITRNFENVSSEAYEKLLDVEKSDLYKARLDEVFNGEIGTITEKSSDSEKLLINVQNAIRTDGYINVSSTYLNNKALLTLTKEQRELLVNCLYKDLTNRTSEQKYTPDATPRAVLTFASTMNETEDGESVVEAVTVTDGVTNAEKTVSFDGAVFENSSFFKLNQWDVNPTVAVTADMKNTVNFLKKLGVYDELTAVPEFTSAEVISKKEYVENNKWRFDEDNSQSRYFVGSYVNLVDKTDTGSANILQLDFGGTPITDNGQIKELLKNAYTFCEDNGEAGYYVAFYTGNKEAATICFIPESKSAGLSFLK